MLRPVSEWLNRRWRAAAGAALALGTIFYVSSAVWRARQTLREASNELKAEGRIAFREIPLTPSAPAGFEPLTAPSGFHAAAVHRGRLMLGGAAGLIEIDPSGEIVSQYAAGLELPPAPVNALAAGCAGEQGEPELWLATAGEGLLAFNGHSFRHFLPEDPAHRTINALLPLSTGRVLLGSDKSGVLVFDGETLAHFHPALKDLPVTALAGSETELWAGTADRGAIRWRAGEVARYGEAEGLPDKQVLSLAVEGERAFVGTALGVAEFRAGRFERVLAPGFFARALALRGGSLAIGSLEEGVVEAPLAARPPRGPRPRGIEVTQEVRQLLELEGKLYALTPDGLEPLEGGRRFPAYTGRPQLADRNISALAIDPSGQLWVGFFDRGLQILAGGGASRHIETSRVFCVNRIAADERRGLVAVATANGLVLFDAAGNVRQTLDRGDGLIANHVTDVAVRDNGLVAATPAGITFLDDSGARSLYAFHGLVNNHVYALGAAGGMVLAGTLGGLSVLEAGVVRASFTTANSALGHNWITAVAEAGGEWFIGTYGAGVLRFDTSGRWESFPEMPKGLEINPNAMAATARGVYAGSLTQGLLVFDRAASRWRRVTAGLPSKSVTAVAARGDFLYIGTSNGLVRVPEAMLANSPNL